MPSQIIACTKSTDGYRVTVHLDTSKVDKEFGSPLPEYVRQWTWGLPQPSEKPLHENGGHAENGEFHHACHTQHGQDMTEQQFLENIMAMLPQMVENELHQMNGSTHHRARLKVVKALHGKEIH